MRKSNPQNPPNGTPPGDVLEKVLIYRDVTAINTANAILNVLCPTLNQTAERLANAGLLPNGITAEIATDLCFAESSAIVEAIKADTPVAENDVQRFVDESYLGNKCEKVDAILYDLNKELEKMQYHSPRLMMHEISQFVKVSNGVITFSPDEILAAFSDYAETPEALQYINEAKALFDSIANFDRKTRILSHGKTRFIGDAEPGAIPEFVAVYNGKIRLDLANIASLDFAGYNENASTIGTDNAEIIKAER